MPVEFYATVDAQSIRDCMPADVAYLLPVSSWVRRWNPHPLGPDPERDHFPLRPIPVPTLPVGIGRVAADCGGFVATNTWGGYKFLTHQYVRWLDAIGEPLRWAAIPDLCCEPEIATSGAEIRERQDAGTDQVAHVLEYYRDAPWAWVPTVQGWEVGDYRRHARELRPYINDLQRHYQTWPDLLYDESDEPEPGLLARVERTAGDFRVGIGTLCRRASVEQIHAIVSVVAEELPGVSLHLWGVKLGALTRPLPSAVVSVDSAAWNGRFGSNLTRLRERARVLGMTQREYGYRVSLPSYVARFECALAGAHARVRHSA